MDRRPKAHGDWTKVKSRVPKKPPTPVGGGSLARDSYQPSASTTGRHVGWLKRGQYLAGNDISASVLRKPILSKEGFDEMLTLTIDGRVVNATNGQSVLQVARQAGIYVPSLCAHPDLTPLGTCGLCIVEIEGLPDSVPSCLTPADEGMMVRTCTPQVDQSRRNSLELILSRHPHACLICSKRATEQCNPHHLVEQGETLRPCAICPSDKHCELQRIADFIGIKEINIPMSYRIAPVETGHPLFDRDPSLCVVCGRCVKICQEVRGVKAIDFVHGQDGTIVGVAPVSGNSLKDSGCKFCGACVEVCPTGALRDKGGLGEDREATLVPCRFACPAGVDIPRYILSMAEGRFTEATAIIRENLPFPSVLGRVCSHPCEMVCRRGQVNESVAICSLKRYAAEHGDRLRQQSKHALPTGRRVAIVGSGPCGLTAAYHLAKLGHQVTVFEAMPEPGGMMRLGIPAYRLPRDVLRGEIEEIQRVGFDIKTETRIDSVDTLFKDGYEAVLVAPGAHKGVRMGIKGENSPGVLEGVCFLREVALGREVSLGKKVAVVGGGNVAVDAARSALRLGAEQVNVLYRRTRAEMPASAEEIEEALREGVNIDFLVAPVSVTSTESGRINLICVRMKLGKKWDAQGRRRPEPIEGSEFSLELDTVIAAIGQEPQIPDGFGLPIRDKLVEADPVTFATSRPGVFAGGDGVIGPASVIQAIAAGKGAASSIDKYLGGDGIVDVTLATTAPDPWLGPDSDFASWPRSRTPLLPVEQRLASFAEVELGFDQKQAIQEAKRCLRCHLRLRITPAVGSVL
ncbi:MAG: FAD-dependent oxidoreductase [Dehalococcoidia bacterium]|nr:FAD-dependent oxidoreductase [Dehalococcoidia bacterium]